MRFVVAFLAFALIALPFGMGSMMNHATAHEAHAEHHALHHDGVPVHKGKAMDSMVCGACLSLASPMPAMQEPPIMRMAAPVPAVAWLCGHAPLPAIPPPRA